MNNNLQLYINTLSTSHYIDNIEGMVDDSEDSTISIPFRFTSEQRGKDNFIKNTKDAIYNSIEYKRWVKWNKQFYGPPICCISNNTVTIEVHHHPLVLEDYVWIALGFLHDLHIQYTANIIADLVLRWHYEGIVCTCFVCKTEHKNFHDNHDKVIPEDAIHGDIYGYLTDDIIKQYINDYHLTKIYNYMPEFAKEHSELFKDMDYNNYSMDELSDDR